MRLHQFLNVLKKNEATVSRTKLNVKAKSIGSIQMTTKYADIEQDPFVTEVNNDKLHTIAAHK